MTSTIPPLMGMAEIGDLVGASAPTVSNWRARFEDFPAPVAELKCGNIYLKSEALAFLARHPNLGQGRYTIPETIRDGIRSQVSAGNTNVAGLARQAGISRNSVYVIAGDLLFPQTG